jgi:chromate reductase
LPGTLKNALDWASRPAGESAFKDKPVAAIGASPGRHGAARAQTDVRAVLSAMGAETLETELPVPRVREKFDDAGALQDDEIGRRLTELVGALIALAGEPAPPPPESAEYSVACQRLAATAD